MTDRAVLEKIVQALADYLKRDAGSIQPSYHLRDDLGLDSMAVIELLYKIEETFDLQIPDQDLAGLSTVGAVAHYVERRLAPAERPDRKSTRLNSSHVEISYAVFCLKKKKKKTKTKTKEKTKIKISTKSY